MRAYKKTCLSILGVVDIPVKLYKATEGDVSLSQVSMCCNDFVGYKKVCKKCGKELHKEDIGRGFWDGVELTPINQDQLDEIKLTTTEKIDLRQCVDQLPPVLYTGKTYYLGLDEKRDKKKQVTPNLEARKDYAMLKEGLESGQRTLVGKTVLRDKEEIVAISSYKGGLLLSILAFPEKIRDNDELLFDIELTDEEKTDSLALVKSMKTADLREYKDEYTEQLTKILAGETIPVQIVKEVKTETSNKWKVAVKINEE